jgi:hypothetical protein
MIDSLYYGLGFVVYVLACMLTINTYNKKTIKNPSVFPMYFIYFYYTVLAGWLISRVDSAETFGIVFAQIAIYAVAGAIFLYTHYGYILKEIDYTEKKDGSF